LKLKEDLQLSVAIKYRYARCLAARRAQAFSALFFASLLDVKFSAYRTADKTPARFIAPIATVDFVIERSRLFCIHFQLQNIPANQKWPRCIRSLNFNPTQHRAARHFWVAASAPAGITELETAETKYSVRLFACGMQLQAGRVAKFLWTGSNFSKGFRSTSRFHSFSLQNSSASLPPAFSLLEASDSWSLSPFAVQKLASMADTAAADAPKAEETTKAVTKAKAPKAAKPKAAPKPKGPAAHPTYVEMIKDAIVSLKVRHFHPLR
jgi:hypothetical protein